MISYLSFISKLPAFVAVGFSALLSQYAAAATLHLPPTAEGYIRTTQSADSINNFESGLLLIGDTAKPEDAFRGVLSFDLSRVELEGAEIISARLVMPVLNRDASKWGGGSKVETLQLHALQGTFEERSVDWDHSETGKQWDVPGGDFGAVLSELEVHPAQLQPGQHLVFSSDSLRSMLQASCGQPISFLVKLAQEDAERSVLRLHPGRCVLEVEYQPTESYMAAVAAGLKALSGPLVGQPEVPVDYVVPVPGHPEAPQSQLYTVYAGGHSVEVRHERYDFDVAMFTLGDAPVLVDVMVEEDFGQFSLKPDRYEVRTERIENVIRFTIDTAHKMVLQIPGKRPLAIIVTPLESEVPDSSDPNVIYFEPGISLAGVIQPKSGQTIYLAPGALVKGRIEARGVENVRILGRGLLETEGYSIRGDQLHGILFDQSKHIQVEGIGVRSYDTWWQTLFLNTIDAEVAHVNIFGIGVNTDGVDIDAVKDFLVRDSFIRCEDDGLGWHSLDAATNGEMITENVVADNLVIWNTTAGNGIRIGASMEAQLWRNITIRNVDILMHSGAGIYSDYSDWAWMENLRFENVTIERAHKPIDFFIGKTSYSNRTKYLNEMGHFDGLLFEGVTMNGGTIKLRGYDQTHRIHAVRFNNCVNAGKPVDSAAKVNFNEYVTDLRFNQPLPERPVRAEGIYEVEDLESRVQGGVQYIADNPDSSSGRHRVFIPKSEGANLEFDVLVSEAGAYNIAVLLRRSHEGSDLEVSLNGDVIIERLSLDASESGFQAVDCGRHVLSAGILKLGLRVVGAGAQKWELDAVRLQAK